jgi:hypothetical protein
MTDLLKIIINRDNVTICGTIVLRPDYVGVTEWKEFWENALENDSSTYEDGYEDGYEACRSEMEEKE